MTRPFRRVGLVSSVFIFLKTAVRSDFSTYLISLGVFLAHAIARVSSIVGASISAAYTHARTSLRLDAF